MFLILGLILSGLIVGALGRLAIPGPNPMSIPMTILVGLGGSFIGGLIGRLLFGNNGGGLILSVAGAAVEELMRYTGPTGMMVRRAREDVEMRDKTMQAGEHVFLGVAAANHDPARFADPDRLDITRADKSHLGFGFGIHHCLGAPLARLEVEVTLTRLLERCRAIRLGEQPAWSSSVMGRSLQRLIVDVA